MNAKMSIAEPRSNHYVQLHLNRLSSQQATTCSQAAAGSDCFVLSRPRYALPNVFMSVRCRDHLRPLLSINL